MADYIQKSFCEQWLWVKINPVRSLCCFPYWRCKTSFIIGGTAAKCTHNPIDIPVKLIRNRRQEEKVTIAKFLCCWVFFLREVNNLVRFVCYLFFWFEFLFVGTRCKCTQKSGFWLTHFRRVSVEYMSTFCSNVFFPYGMDEKSNLNLHAESNCRSEWMTDEILYLFIELFIQSSEAWYPKLTVPL